MMVALLLLTLPSSNGNFTLIHCGPLLSSIGLLAPLIQQQPPFSAPSDLSLLTFYIYHSQPEKEPKQNLNTVGTTPALELESPL